MQAGLLPQLPNWSLCPQPSSLKSLLQTLKTGYIPPLLAPLTQSLRPVRDAIIDQIKSMFSSRRLGTADSILHICLQRILCYNNTKGISPTKPHNFPPPCFCLCYILCLEQDMQSCSLPIPGPCFLGLSSHDTMTPLPTPWLNYVALFFVRVISRTCLQQDVYTSISTRRF